jgi:tetratricopeptide (TPR) repeat protein
LSKKKRKKAEGLSAKPVAPSETIKKGLSLSRLHLLAVALIVVVALITYANTFHVPFHFDDWANIHENPHIRIKPFTFDRLEELARHTYSFSIRIFSYFTFALNYYFGEFEVFGYHLINLLIHIASGLFLYWLLLLTLNLPSLKERYGSMAFSIALFSSLLFIAHPIQTQSVTYIVQRMASMAGMFYLLAMLFYVKGRLSKGTPRLLYWVGMVLSYLFGLFSKENVAILPLFVALYEFYFFQNLDMSLKGKKVLTFLIGSVFLIGVLIFLFWGKRYFDVIIEGYKIRDFTLTQRVLTQFRVVLYYVTLLLYPSPSRLILDYDFPTSRGILDPPTTLLSMLIIAGLIGYSIWTAKRRPLLSYFVLWYLGNLVIESSIFPLEMVCEHRLYLPAIGPFILFAILVVSGWEKIKGIEHSRQKAEGKIKEVEGSKQETEGERQEAEDRKPAYVETSAGRQLGPRSLGVVGEAESSLRRDLPLWIFILLISFLLCVGSYQRNAIWKDEITLWEDCLKKSPNKPRVHTALGYYLGKKNIEKGIEEYNIALTLNPNYPEAHFNLGRVYGEMKLFEKAVYHLEQYLRLKPKDPRGYNELGLINLQKKKYDEAILFFKKGLEMNPYVEKLHANLGDVYLQTHRLDEAVVEYKKAIQLNPRLTEIYLKMAEAYTRKGLPDLAMEVLRKAPKTGPSLYEAHVIRGATYVQEGKIDEGIAELKQALKFNSRDPKVYNNLGVAYRRKNLLNEAIANYKKALELDPSFSEARINLGETYFGKGMTDEAISELQHAIQLDPNKAEVHNNLGAIYLQQKRLDEAISSFKKAVALNPKYGDAYFNLALAYYYKKDLPTASTYARKALDLGYEVDPRLLKMLHILQ